MELTWGHYLFFAAVLILLQFKLVHYFERRLRWLAANHKFVGSIVVSIAVLGAGLYIILSKEYETDSQKWAFGAVGTILGYWLRPTDD
jgi:hypothetical protein